MRLEAKNNPVGIFGGTFDPIHYGHLRLAEAAADALNLSAVRWIPNGQPVLRESPSISARQRLDMVRLAISGNSRFELDVEEAETQQPSYTVPTLERLRRPDVYGPRRSLVLLVGADAFASLTQWHRWESLFDLAHIAVAHRPGYDINAEHLTSALADVFRQRFCNDAARLADVPAGRIVTFAMTPLDISATKIRTLLSKGLSPRYLLPENVIAHILNHRFYLEN